jgi:esterase/lipase superfamily enzyme
MRRDSVIMHSPAIGDTNLIAIGHFGKPFLVFPSDSGWAFDFENNGLLDAVRQLVDDGRAKFYCIDSFETQSWRRSDLPLELRAREHERYENYILGEVLPFIYEDCGGQLDVTTVGCSFGAVHSANLVLRHADRFPRALCMSGSYDLSRMGWGERGDTFYFNNPMDYVTNLHGDHLEWLRSRVHLSLVVGQGPWEDESASGSLSGTRRFANLLAEKEIPHELDVWGHDSAHDWPWWRKQIALHLPNMC